MKFSTRIANLGKYNAGMLTDTELPLPATTAQVQAIRYQIGVAGLRYEEIIICEYSLSIPGLSFCLMEYAYIDELK